jgi:hypothetical protein
MTLEEGGEQLQLLDLGEETPPDLEPLARYALAHGPPAPWLLAMAWFIEADEDGDG